MRTSAGSFYYTTDALGSIILLTDSTQAKAATYSYDSWGNATSTGTQAANNPWQYAGGYYEAPTNRVKMGARYYNPYRGRLTQTDPSGQEANRYAYVQCNPINATDPSGLWNACQGLGAAAAGIGVFAFGLAGWSIAADLSIVAAPAGISLGILAGAAGAFAGLTGAASWLACQAGW